MVAFIARMIMKGIEEGAEVGQTRYGAYFVNTNLYLRYKDEVDAILRTEGFGNAIIE